MLDIWKATTWRSIHTFTRHYALVRTSSTGASFGTVVLEAAMYSCTLLIYDDCLSVNPSGIHLGGPTLKEESEVTYPSYLEFFGMGGQYHYSSTSPPSLMLLILFD